MKATNNGLVGMVVQTYSMKYVPGCGVGAEDKPDEDLQAQCSWIVRDVYTDPNGERCVLLQPANEFGKSKSGQAAICYAKHIHF